MRSCVVVLIFALFSGLADAQSQREYGKNYKNEGSSHIEDKTDCVRNIESRFSPRAPARLSAFRVFNRYPPVASILRPDTVSFLGKRIVGLDGACLERPSIKFNVLEQDGNLREGTPDDLSVYKLWRVEKGFFAAYMYKKYEVGDGEGESIVLALVRYDSFGMIVNLIEEVSSWYEYEGAIRLRDALLGDDSLRLFETVYDVEEVDEQGNVVKYSNNRPSISLEITLVEPDR
ncbi:hypothetical protein [Pseudomonas sp. zfem002]|uniref:hypothetical protein n=1 Tax=Pseudomonas sp. zfem002 TaxID=3078197 RepID=UPI002927D99F|nr:hypothetical protein [Pseudomonas sp. zfem002]MDU9393970.1 hypothetical protein [Pseudomonas sp. zfem002]